MRLKHSNSNGNIRTAELSCTNPYLAVLLDNLMSRLILYDSITNRYGELHPKPNQFHQGHDKSYALTQKCIIFLNFVVIFHCIGPTSNHQVEHCCGLRCSAAYSSTLSWSRYLVIAIFALSVRRALCQRR